MLVRFVRWLACLVSSSWWALLCPAFSAVDWSVWVGFEGNFAFLTAFRAGCLVHFFFCHRLFSTPVSVFLARVDCAGFICGWFVDIRFVVEKKLKVGLGGDEWASGTSARAKL